ncbi:MAG: hypothetical protein U1E02_45060 [Hydrogenophaga sp.]|nr:hypothetical protein [Hydrogenophaga sp.]MDZ4131297.1 hypothetical protein [Hydrogenophaga sp.]
MIGGLSPLVRLRDFSFGRMRVGLAGGVWIKNPTSGLTYQTEDYETYKVVFSSGLYSLNSQGGSYLYPIDFYPGKSLIPPFAPEPVYSSNVDAASWKANFEDFSTEPNPYLTGDVTLWPLVPVSFVASTANFASSITVYKLHDVFEPFTSDMGVYPIGAVVVVSRVVDGARQEIWRTAPGVNLSTRQEGGRLLVLEAKKLRLTYDPLPDVLAHLDHFGERLEVWMETEMSGGSRVWRRLFRSAPAAQVSIAALQSAGLVDGDGYVTQLDSAGQLPVYGRNALGPFSVVDTFRPAT